MSAYQNIDTCTIISANTHSHTPYYTQYKQASAHTHIHPPAYARSCSTLTRAHTVYSKWSCRSFSMTFFETFFNAHVFVQTHLCSASKVFSIPQRTYLSVPTGAPPADGDTCTSAERGCLEGGVNVRHATVSGPSQSCYFYFISY